MIHHIGEYGNKYLVKYFQRLSGQFRDIPTSYKIPLKKFAVLRFFAESMGPYPCFCMFRKNNFPGQKCHSFPAPMFACLNPTEQLDHVSPRQYLEGIDTVFYLPKYPKSRLIDIIQNHFHCRAVLSSREKLVCWKCCFRIFPNFNPPARLSLSEPLSFDYSNECEDESYAEFAEEDVDSDFSKKMERVRLFKTIKRLKKQVDAQQMKIIRLSCKLDAIREGKVETRCPPQTTPEGLFNDLMTEMQGLIGVPKKGRRFSQLLLDVSQILLSLSPRCYRLLRQVFVFPSISTLYYHFGTQLQQIRARLTSTDSIDALIKEIKDEPCGENEDIFTLGIDAFAFRSFCGQTFPQSCKNTTVSLPNSDIVNSETTNSDVTEQSETKPLSNGFMFLLIPLSPTRKCRLLNISTRPKGNYDETIDEVVSIIKSAMIRHGLKLFFKATDGDRFLSQEHDSFFTSHFCAMPPGSTFSQVTDAIFNLLQKSEVTMPIADPLHFAKNARSKLLKHPIVLHYSQTKMHSTTLETLRGALPLGKVFEDTSPLAAMRDSYVTELFYLKNVAKLLEKGLVHDAFLLLPYASIFAAIFEPDLLNETRTSFIELAYHCYWHFLVQAPIILKNYPNVHGRFRKGVSAATTIAEEGFIVRMIHTCIAFAIALRYGPRRVRMDAIGTHLVENRIGNARAGCNDPRWVRILSNSALAEIRKMLARKHNPELYWSKRINHGGAKVDTLTDKGLTLPESWRPELILKLFTDTLEKDGTVTKELESFAAELRKISKFIRKPTLGNASEVANNAIMARNISFGATLWREAMKPDAEIADEDELEDASNSELDPGPPEDCSGEFAQQATDI